MTQHRHDLIVVASTDHCEAGECLHSSDEGRKLGVEQRDVVVFCYTVEFCGEAQFDRVISGVALPEANILKFVWKGCV